MDYSAIIDKKKYSSLVRLHMAEWLIDNVKGNRYLWEIAESVHIVYFKFETDLLVFRLRWGV